MNNNRNRNPQLATSKNASKDSGQAGEKPETYDSSSNHSFLAPNEILPSFFGLLSCLMDKRLIDMSFSKICEQSGIHGWKKILSQERQKLKPNENSVLKSLPLNRLCHECVENSIEFHQKVQNIQDELQQRMRAEFPPGWTAEDLYEQVRYWQDMQCRRRLFYFSYSESRPLSSFLMLHKAASNWCYCLINHCRKNKTFWKNEGRQRLIEHLQHSFIIVAQPTGSEGTAVTQYTKVNSSHSARLHCRLICLLDPVLLKDYLDLSEIEVTLQPLNREMKEKIEKQPNLTWQQRVVTSSEGFPITVMFAEILSVQLEKFDANCKRLLLNSTLCQLEFRLKVQIRNPSFEGFITLTSHPFGICSHGQYFPKYLAKIFLYEINQILSNNQRILEPNLLTEFVGRYHIRIAGCAPAEHTVRCVRQLFESEFEEVQQNRMNNNRENLYEENLAKIIHQIDIFVLYPVLSMMYEDNLFLGICNAMEMDRKLCGTTDQPQMLLRLNAFTQNQGYDSTTVQFIIHDGHLRRANFDMKTFANELCRFICESVSDSIKVSTVFSSRASRSFSDFNWYFDAELYRLNKMVPPSGDIYDPLLPILWMTMRKYPIGDMKSKRKRSSSTEGSTSDSNPIKLFNNKQSNPLTVTERVDGTSKRELLIQLPAHISVSTEAIERFLQEKFFHFNGDSRENHRTRTVDLGVSTTIPQHIEIKSEAEEYSD